VIFSWRPPSKTVGVSGTGPRGIETGEKKTRNVFDLLIRAVLFVFGQEETGCDTKSTGNEQIQAAQSLY
jgi:hypothetical protein